MSINLSHRNDPPTSADAAAHLNPSKTAQVQQAILELLAEEPRAAFQLQAAYFELAKDNGWPIVQPHSVPRRLSQLHVAGLVRESGRRVMSPAGATATVWEIAND